MTIYERRWPPDTCGFHQAVLQAILAREARYPGLRVSNVVGWHSQADLTTWTEDGVAGMVERIADDAARACEGMGRVQAWANVMREGAYHLAHRHGEADWSGVYYLDAGTPGCGGRITFARGGDARTLAPETGLMLIFPGDLLHSVELYTGTTPRVSVAFNLLRD